MERNTSNTSDATSDELDMVLIYCERLPPFKPNDPLKKIYMSTFTRLMATKLGRVLTLGRGSTCKRLSRHQLVFYAFKWQYF